MCMYITPSCILRYPLVYIATPPCILPPRVYYPPMYVTPPCILPPNRPSTAPLRVLVSDSLTARVGEPVELLCEGEGSGVSVEWSRVEGSLREGGVVSSSVGQVTSKYQIMAVTVADDGDYVCTVRSPYFEQPLYAIITLTVLGKNTNCLYACVILRLHFSLRKWCLCACL